MLSCLIAVGLPAQASPLNLEFVQSVPRGYFGCLSDSASSYLCMIVLGSDSGVRIIVRALGDETVGTGPWTFRKSYVEDATVAADALQVVAGTGTTVPALRLVAELPRTGRLDLRMQTPSPFSVFRGTLSNCEYELFYELQTDATDEVIGGAVITTGTIDGYSTREVRENTSHYFWGPVSGAWALIGLVDEAVVP